LRIVDDHFICLSPALTIATARDLAGLSAWVAKTRVVEEFDNVDLFRRAIPNNRLERAFPFIPTQAPTGIDVPVAARDRDLVRSPASRSSLEC